MEGKIFQTIPCFKPQNLMTFSVGEDVFLAFLEAEHTVKVFGMESIREQLLTNCCLFLFHRYIDT